MTFRFRVRKKPFLFDWSFVIGKIPEQIIADILARTDVVSIVGRYVSLKKAGTNHKGLCPFHSEKTPSFNVHSGKGIYKCFGCGEGGNAIGFLMAIEGWNFPEAVRHLAQEHGIVIPDTRDEKDHEREKGRKVYLKIMKHAHTFFKDQLQSKAGEGVHYYLRERGIDAETAETFGLGYAPNDWSKLAEYLSKNKIPAPWAAKAGLLSPRDRGGFYDKFRHRVVFPIVDIWGNTLAFGGRVLAAEDQPKYMNSPETPYYTKGKHLYGLMVAKNYIQKSGVAIIVEGNFDVISLHAHGVKNVVAPMGTAFTNAQAKLLSRYCKKVILAFDGDNAGQNASLKCLPALEESEIESRIIVFDKKDDPDTFVRREGAEALQAMIDASETLMGWAIAKQLPGAEKNIDVRKQVQGLEVLGELLAHVKNPVMRERYIGEISRRVAIEPRLLKAYIRRPDKIGSEIQKVVTANQKPAQLTKTEFGILVVLLDQPQWLEEFFSEQYNNLLSSEELVNLLTEAHQNLGEDNLLNAGFLIEKISNASLKNSVEDALVSVDAFYSEEKSRTFFTDCIFSLKKDWVIRTIDEINRELASLDFKKDREAYKALIKQKKDLEEFKQNIEQKK